LAKRPTLVVPPSVTSGTKTRVETSASNSSRQDTGKKANTPTLDLKFTATDGREVDLAHMRGK